MLEKLFSPFSLKGKTLKNRCVVPPMVVNYCNPDGTATEKFMAYHEAKAKGGFAMIITEDFAVTPTGRGFKYLPGLWNDEQIPGFTEFTKRIHKHDTVIIAQIYHCGRQTSKEVCGQDPWAPSAIPCPFSADMPHEMTIEEIKLTVSQYGDCARRAKEAGFDGVEIHGAHGYLIAEFMSHYSNKRTDIYGGSLTNRMRFALEVIADVRKKCGDDFIVGYRISADEYVTGGRTIEDTKTIVPYLEAEGIDYLHITAGVYRSFDAVIPSMYRRHGWIANLAAEVKTVTDLPVITVGRINDPLIANTILESGQADLISMGRQSLTDPETPNKAKEGRFDEIRTCIGCHHACVGNLLNNKPIKCILNPTLGMESEYLPIQAEEPKKVIVIGAGPAGLEAAVSAASCGHKVKVYEKNRWAGGQFRLGAVPPGKGEIINFINWQLNQLDKLGVSVSFNTEVTFDLVKEENPDVIIAATGVTPIIPRIPGVDKANVVTAADVLSGVVNTGNRIVVIGGGCVGAETANHLASNLKSVTLVEMQDDIALDEIVVPRWGLLEDLESNHVRICTRTTVEEIKDGAVKVSGAVNEEIPADTIVLAVGSKPAAGFVNILKEAGYDVRTIGDAAKVGLAGEAIAQGFELGRAL
jgi:2,4-dienoyl-CoA reductase-like NADH-dependent reductase (Old Yellow Enzyme family)/thioredoxin reductase